MKPRILIVDEDPLARRGMETNLKNQGYEIIVTGGTNDAMHAVRQQKPDLLIVDLSLVKDGGFNGIRDGFSLLHWVRYTVSDPTLPVIIYTADNSPEVERLALASNVFAVLRKGDNLVQLVSTVHSALPPGDRL